MNLWTILLSLGLVTVFASSASSPQKTDRIKEIVDGEALLNNRLRRTSPLPLRLRMRLGVDRIYDYSYAHSFTIMNACLEYLEWPADHHTLESKTATIKKISSLIDEEENKQAVKLALISHTCHDAFKTLGEVMTPNQCRKIESICDFFFIFNPQLFSSLKDFSWVTQDFLKKLMASGMLKGLDLFSRGMSAFVKTAPIEVLADAVAYDFDFKTVDALQDRLFQSPEAARILSLYPIISTLPMDKRRVPDHYDYDSSLLVADLKSNGLTKVNLSVLLAYAQVTDALIFRNLNTLAEGWVEATLNWEFDDAEVVKARIDDYYQRATFTLDIILDIRDARAELMSVVDDLNSCEAVIVKEFPEWKQMLRTFLRNPVNGHLRFILLTLPNLEFHPVILPEDADSILPLPRLNQNERLESANVMQKRHPMLWNALIRNVFFVDGESWRQEVGSDFDWANVAAVKDHLRQNWQFIYDHSQDVPVNFVQYISDRFKLFKFLFKFSVSAKNFLLEFAEILPPKDIELPPGMNFEFFEELENVYHNFLLSIPSRHFAMADLDYLGFLFRASSKLTDLIEIYKQELSTPAPQSVTKIGFTVNWEVLGTCLKLLKDSEALVFKGKNNEAQQLLFKASHLITVIEALVFLCGTDVKAKNFQKILNDSVFAELFNCYGRLFTADQVKGLLACEEGRAFLKRNLAGAQTLIEYSAFTESLLKEIGLSVDNIRLNLSTLPLPVKLISLSRCKFMQLTDPIKVSVLLGANFWNESGIIANPTAWTALNPLVSYMLDPIWTQSLQVIMITNTPILKCKTFEHICLEASIQLLTKWLINREWLFFSYLVLMQKYGTDVDIRKRLYSGYRYILIAEEIASNEIAVWIEQVLPIVSRPEIRSMIELIRANLSTPLTSLRRSHCLAVVSEIASGDLFMIQEGTLYRANNPYSTTVELSKVLSTSAVASTEVLERIKMTLKDESFWVARLEVVQQFDKDSLTGNLMDAYKLLNRLTTFDAIIYKFGLEMMGVNANAILAKSVPFFDEDRRMVPLKVGEITYHVSFGSGSQRIYEVANEEEIAACQAYKSKIDNKTKKKSSIKK